MTKILSPIFWEFLQNLPLTLAFTFGYTRWRSGDYGVIWIAAGGALAGAVLIRFTEPLIEPGPIEKPAVTLANFLAFWLAIPIFIAYFRRIPGNWLIDIALGLATGATIALIQARISKGLIISRHLLSMSIAVPITLLTIRFLVLRIAPLPGAAILCTIATLVIVVLEYTKRAAP